MSLVITVVLVLTMGAAAVSDLRTRRIPNWLTLGGLAAALVLRALAGVHPLVDGLAGAGLGFGLGLLCMILGALGGGDGKLLMAAGAFFGFRPFLGALLLIGVLGGLLGIAEAVRQRAILPSVYNAGGMLRRWATLGRLPGPARSLDSPGAVKVPYGLAIALGAVIWWFWGVPVSMITRTLTRFAKNENGQAVVEFALIMPFLLLFLLGIVEFGRAWNEHEVLTDATREGARKGAIFDPATHDRQRHQFGQAGARVQSHGARQCNHHGHRLEWRTGDDVVVQVAYPYRFVFFGAMANWALGDRKVLLTSKFIMRKE